MENKILPYLITFCALLVSGSAAFYSVYGLGKMFAGAAVEVMILAGSLEFSKLVIASFLYRYWQKISGALRYYLVFATILLVLITSGGIYGFLSSAYQETSTKVEMGEGQIELLISQKSMLEKEKVSIESSIEKTESMLDKRIEKSSSDRSLASLERSEKEANKKIKVLRDSLTSKNTQIYNIETEILKIENNPELASDIGPLKYISQITGKSMDQIVNWFIIALMIVFDPLAIALVISANMAFTINKKRKDGETENNLAASLKTPENPDNNVLIDDPQELLQEAEESPETLAVFSEKEPEATREEKKPIEIPILEDPESNKKEVQEAVDPVENLNKIIEKHLKDEGQEQSQDVLKKNLSVEVKEPEKITGESINTIIPPQQIDPTRLR